MAKIHNGDRSTVADTHASPLELIEISLASAMKLERDRACESLRTVIGELKKSNEAANNNVVASGVEQLKLKLIDCCRNASSSTLSSYSTENIAVDDPQSSTSISWTSTLGALSALLVLAQERCIDHDTDISSLLPIVLALLEHHEVRVRLLATDLIGALAPLYNDNDIAIVKTHAYKLVREHIERHVSGGTPTAVGGMLPEEEMNNYDMIDQTSRSPPPGLAIPADSQNNRSMPTPGDVSPRRSLSRSSSGERPGAERYSWHESKQLLHETAGWKILETSMQCLQRLAEGLRARFKTHIDDELLNLLLDAAAHTNRFVRESCQFTCGAIIADLNEEEDVDLIVLWAPLIVKILCCGLSDNWSQVRYAASVGCRKFFRVVRDETRRSQFYSTLLAPMCLNRYYMAEGVKHYSIESWHLAFGLRGKQLVTQYIGDVINFYLLQAEADNHAVREAACHCLAELATKIDHATVQPHVARLMEALLHCFEDDSWPVRDTACLASGSFVEHFARECEPFLSQLYERFFENQTDSIASVRQGGAQTIAAVVWTYRNEPEKSIRIVEPRLQASLTTDLAAQPASTEQHNVAYEKSPGDFGVVKRTTGIDERAENQQMYSCGSLAPKMMHRGGCSGGSHFKKPGEPWEAADGSALLIYELCRLFINKDSEGPPHISAASGNGVNATFESASVPTTRPLAARFAPGLSPATSVTEIEGTTKTPTTPGIAAALHPIMLNSTPSSDGIAGSENLHLPPRRMLSENRMGGAAASQHSSQDHHHQHDTVQALLESTIPWLLESTRYKHYAAHTTYFRTIMRLVPQLCRALGKPYFKQHCLEQFCDVIFYSLQNDNFALSAAAADDCLKPLAQLLGPSILAARIEIVNPQYARMYEQYEQQRSH